MRNQTLIPACRRYRFLIVPSARRESLRRRRTVSAQTPTVATPSRTARTPRRSPSRIGSLSDGDGGGPAGGGGGGEGGRAGEGGGGFSVRSGREGVGAMTDGRA